MRLVTFASGSTGNCALVSAGKHVLIDAGISLRRIRANLSLSGLTPEDVSGVLITHEHSDHISGLAMLVKYHKVPVYAPAAVASFLRGSIPGIDACLSEIAPDEAFSLGEMSIRAFPTPHDARQSVGYRIESGAVFGFATDMGHVTEETVSGLSGADAAVIEANHDTDMLLDGPYPAYLKRRVLSERGHLSNKDSAALGLRLAEGGTRTIILGHLSRENNTPSLACRTVREALGDKEVFVCAAPADQRLTVEIKERQPCFP